MTTPDTNDLSVPLHLERSLKSKSEQNESRYNPAPRSSRCFMRRHPVHGQRTSERIWAARTGIMLVILFVDI